jgi:hypothetical protein
MNLFPILPNSNTSKASSSTFFSSHMAPPTGFYSFVHVPPRYRTKNPSKNRSYRLGSTSGSRSLRSVPEHRPPSSPDLPLPPSPQDHHASAWSARRPSDHPPVDPQVGNPSSFTNSEPMVPRVLCCTGHRRARRPDRSINVTSRP